MIISSGLGFLSLVLAVLGIVGGIALVDATAGLGLGLSEQAGFASGLALAAVVNWLAGQRLNQRPGRELIDAQTGERVMLRRRHRLFGVPMQFWSVAMLVFAILAVTSSRAPNAWPSPVLHGRGPG